MAGTPGVLLVINKSPVFFFTLECDLRSDDEQIVII